MIYTTKYNIIHNDKVIAVCDTTRQALNSTIVYITTKCNDYVALLQCNNVAEHHNIIAKLSEQLLLNGVLIISTKNNKKIKIIEI